ncbi:MAG: hypothetical protein JW787_07645 [Sedimentisphaerales bacterium]|nr:hypothetical protein [Sedimentisphaerales bacterium]
MCKRHFIITLLCSLVLSPALTCHASASEAGDAVMSPAKVYVPYEELKKVFETEGQGVFLPYRDFQKLWEAAQGRPAEISKAPFDYLISTARFDGKVSEEIARIKLELTIDILSEDWVQVPLGLGSAAVSNANLSKTGKAEIAPLLRIVDGQYIFTVRGTGRYVLELDFVRQLDIQPGLAVLEYSIPSAAITTLDLLIPEENLKVDVEPMLAATTSQVDANEAGATRLQAFLGSVSKVKLSWKPKTQAAEELESVIICEQFQHIHIDEALLRSEVQLKYNIHRGGVNSFSIQMPDQFRITDVNGANISRWEIKDAQTAGAKPLLNVELYSPVKDQYNLNIKMERFVQEAKAKVSLTPIVTQNVFRQSGLIGITYSSRRTVHVENITNLARVDTGQLPGNLQAQAGVTAYRFITSDYGAELAIETTLPRISVNQGWLLGVDSDKLKLQGRLQYKVEKNGIFELNMNLPEPWKVESVGPDNIVDDHQLIGQGQNRQLHVLLRRETIGNFELRLAAQADRTRPDEIVDFNLPEPDPNNLQLYEGQIILAMAEQLQGEVDQMNQIQPISLRQAQQWTSIAELTPAMAFDFRVIDTNSPAGGRFRVTVKPTQISATVHRLVNIQQGSIDHEAIVQYTIRYAPVDTFYLKVPAKFADEGIDISGQNIKEKPRIGELPQDQIVDSNESSDQREWAYYKIVLQSKVNNNYQLMVKAHRTFKAGEVGQATNVEVPPILAAGKLSDQNGYIAVTKADTLAIAKPVTENLTAGDAGSSVDLPYTPHRQSASLAFKYNTSDFKLTLPVVVQKEAAVFTTIVSAAVIEQVLARDGMLNTHATFFLATSKGERYTVTLPENAELTAVLLNGDEAPREVGVAANEFIVRLPPSAGQVSRFVLEISYGLKGARASKLTAPALSKEIPVQQTLWRVWIPEGYYYLGHSRVFSQISDGYSQNMLYSLTQEHYRLAAQQRSGAGQRNTPYQGDTQQGGTYQGNMPPAGFKLAGQGRNYNFNRQGSPGTLSVMAVSKEVFSILVWIVVIAAGILMLKIKGVDRVMIILAIVLAGGVIYLFQPVFVLRILSTAWFPIGLVLLMWIGRWGFAKMPEFQKNAALRKQKALENRQKKEIKQQAEAKPSQKSDDKKEQK